MKASQLCELREDFIREWQRDFPLVPPPVLRGIDQVKNTDVIDESEACGYIATLWGSLRAVHNKLEQLHEQIVRKQRVKDFLLSVLRSFDTDFDASADSLKLSTYESTTTSNNNVTVSATTNSYQTVHSSVVTVVSSSPNRSVTLSEDKTKLVSGDNNNSDSVLCVPDECAPDVYNTGPTQTVSGITCDISCSTEGITRCVQTDSSILTREIGVQCELGLYRKSDKFLGYKTVINHEVSFNECVNDKKDITRDRAQTVKGRVPVSKQYTEVICNCQHGFGGDDNRSNVIDNGVDDYIDDEVCYYDNKFVKNDMFKKKKGSSKSRWGDEGGSQRGLKDNFLAVSSHRELDEEAACQHHSDKDSTGSGGGGSLRSSPSLRRGGNSPSLTRNFHLLKLTSGFDLVLSDNDSSTDDQNLADDGGSNVNKEKKSGGDKSKNKEQSGKYHDQTIINSDNSTQLEDSVLRSDGVKDINVVQDSKCKDEDSTPTGVHSLKSKLEYDNQDISNVLDGNPPDLVSSTLSKKNMSSSSSSVDRTFIVDEIAPSPKPSPETLDTCVTNRPKSFTNDNVTDTTNETNIKPSSDTRESQRRPPPPVARKPSRPSTGKTLPAIPVGVEPVTRPIAIPRPIQTTTTTKHSAIVDITSQPVRTPPDYHHRQQEPQGTVSTGSTIPSQNVTHPTPTPNLTITPQPYHSDDDKNSPQPDVDHGLDPNQLRPKSHKDSTSTATTDDDDGISRPSSLSSFLSSSPDFRACLSTGMIPMASHGDVVIDQTNPNRQSNFYYDIVDFDPNHVTSSSNAEQQNSPTGLEQGPETDPQTTETAAKNNIGELIHATNSTMFTFANPFPHSHSHDGKSDAGADNITNNEKLTQLEGERSPPPPPLPKRESRINCKHPDEQRQKYFGNATEGLREERDVIIEEASVSPPQLYPSKKEDSNKTTGNYTSAYTPAADEDMPTTHQHSGEFSRMSSTDTLVGDHQLPLLQRHGSSVRRRRSESFTSDIEVKDALFAFDQIISAQCPQPSEESENTMEPSENRLNKRHSSVISYENWTINRALTASISSCRRSRGESTNLDEFNFINDEEEEVDEEDDNDNDHSTTNDDDSSNTSMPSPALSRPSYFTHGSKDSGLCDDMSVTESMHSELDLIGGRITDLRQIQEMERWEEEEEQATSGSAVAGDRLTVPSSENEKDYDSVSVASDIVFMTGSLVKKRDQQSEEDRVQSSIVMDDDDDEDDDDDMDKIDGEAHPKIETSSTASTGSLEDGDGRSMNTSYDETDAAHEGMLKMRQLVIKGILDSEKAYINILELLIHYKKSMEASSRSSQPIISDVDIRAIFGNIEKLHQIHLTFVNSLEAKVKAWTHAECVGDIFKIFVLDFPELGNYVNNYPNAVSTIHKCAQESEQFQKITKQIVVKSHIRENTCLEDALFKPVQRMQRNNLVLHDLIKYTPEDHPDCPELQKALKLSQHNLEEFSVVNPHSSTNPENRRLVKSSFLVELVNGMRKLRYMFLFSDILVCTKREVHRNNKVTFQIKWFAPLAEMTYDTKFAYKDDTKFSRKDDINELKSKIRALKKEMKLEMKKFDDKDKHRSLVNLGGATRTVEKLRKKILQNEGQLILASPKLPFKVFLEGGKNYTMLMTTDYEKEEWKEALNTFTKTKYNPNHRRDSQHQTFSSIFVQDLIDSVKETPQVNKIGNVLLQKDEDMLTGTLNVTIHKMNGLTEECDSYCCLEMDSYGHFCTKARTKLCVASRDPNWNEDFELELEGSLTLRILCFRKGETESGDQLLGRGALELDKHWLKGSFQEKTVSMNEISLVISIRHTPAEKTMQRTPSRTSSAVFGVKISSCARREGKTVPTIITACIHEVEKRGLDEVGIYRVSGVTSDLQRTKKLFDRSATVGASSLEDMDIHAVTGVLKMYLRELPEPLFTEASYQKFAGTLKLSDDEAKSQCILTLLHELPDTNYYTIVCLMEHLVKVARKVGENKMSIHNLSTIFGPTLLAPATKPSTNNDPLAMMFLGAEQVMQQSGVISYLLGLAVSGCSLRRSSS